LHRFGSFCGSIIAPKQEKSQKTGRPQVQMPAGGLCLSTESAPNVEKE
jgi:hypothetical protein